MDIRFDMIAAHEAGESRHPQIVMLELGIGYSRITAHPIADCWIFYDRSLSGSNIPSFLEQIHSEIP